MAAPTFVGAGAGVTIASGSAACTAAGSGVAVGDLVILQVLQDGVAASAVTYSAISGIANLAGTASSLTVLATDQVCGSTAKQHLRVGRATSTTCSVTVATTGDDLYYRLYVFRGVNSGTALTDILENGTAGTIANGSGATAAVADTGVTTLGVDRLALQFVGVDDDNPLGDFAGTTGGVWTEAVAEFASATGTDAAIQLQLGVVGTTIANWPTPPAVDIAIQGAGFSPAAVAQSFASGAGGTVSQVVLQLSAFNAPTDNLIVEIQADAAGQPSGTVVGTAATVPASALGSAEKICVLSVSASLAASTTYWLVLRRSGTPSGSNYFRVTYEPTLVYPGGTASTQDNTGAWVTFLYDLAFVLNYGTAGTINGGSYTMAAADNWGVIGFALKPVPSGTAHTATPADTLALSDSVTPASGKAVAIADTLALADLATPDHVGPPLDNFNRADGGLGSNWTADIQNAGQGMPQIAGNTVEGPAGLGIVSAWWNAAQFGPDTEARITIVDWPRTENGKGIALFLRVSDPGTAGFDGYEFAAVCDTTSGTNDIVVLSRWNNNSQTFFTFPGVAKFQAGDELKAEIVGTTLTLSRKRGGSWTVLTTHDDTTPLTAAGYVGLRLYDGGESFDNFYASPPVAATAWTQPVADTLALADAVASQAVFVRTVTDPLALTDTLAFQRGVVLADTLALADLAATQRGIAQAVADTLALADSLSSAGAFQRAIADTLSLADTLAAQSAFQLAIVDTLNLADALSSQAAFVRALADTLTLADLVDPVKGVGGVDHTQPIADTLVLLDALTLGRGLTVADTLTVADSLALQAAYLRAIADTLVLADTVVTSEAGAQQIADTLALADAIRFDRTLTLADTLALADALTAGSDLTRTIADTLALADSLTAQKAILRALADTVSLADAIRFGRDLGLTDTVALADAVSFQAAYLRTLADTVSLTDAATAGLQFTRAIADTVALLDSRAATLGRAVTLEDVLALADDLDALLTAAVGEPPRASGLIDFPGVGTITRPTRGIRVGNNRGNINTAGEGVLTKPTRGATS